MAIYGELWYKMETDLWIIINILWITCGLTEYLFLLLNRYLIKKPTLIWELIFPKNQRWFLFIMVTTYLDFMQNLNI